MTSSTATATDPANKPSKPARTRKARPAAPDTTRLFLSIRDQVYRVARLKAQDPEIRLGYRLRRADGKAAHDIHVDGHGAHCTCGDHVHRHEGIDDLGCKHV